MVSNHVFDVLSKHDPADLPPALTEYVSRMQREAYDYSEHSRVGAKHGEQITDETCERFCILGPPEAHVEKLRRLEAAGVDQWNIYLMTHGQEETLEAYGREIIPALRGSSRRRLRPIEGPWLRLLPRRSPVPACGPWSCAWQIAAVGGLASSSPHTLCSATSASTTSSTGTGTTR